MAPEQQKLALNGGRDYISSLPDDILSIIVSKLNIVDGLRTTILSTRWRRNLWTLLPTSVLRIHASDFIPSYTKFEKGHKCWDVTEIHIKFEHIVDQILSRYTPDILDELNISYIPRIVLTPGVINSRNPLVKVKTWIEYAKQKSVKTLELSFERLEKMKPLTFTTFSSLITLRLKFPPRLSVEQIQSFLSLSPNLEDLSIVGANACLGSLIIEGSSLKLKHLELISLDITELNISAPNLVSFNSIHLETYILRISSPSLISFNYLGGWKETRVYIGDVPLLSRLSYSESDYSGYSLWDMLILREDLPKNLPRFINSQKKTLLFGAAMTNLIQLKLALGIFIEKRLDMFFRLLEASPSLCKLSLDLGFIAFPSIPNNQVVAVNQCLEEVEIDGFAGFNEVQLVMCIAQSSPLLKKMIIRSSLAKYCLAKSSVDPRGDIFTMKHNVASVVQSLRSSLPQIEFVIIHSV
ncbi:F-box/RNI-like/FBD-like domains-containing protein [Euphorbia peplus]|nr:F-box/RNI-like/FBD-like domains-containing protein [Euphorbia peplus]